jgi:restriction endonuclease S subunit
MSSAVPEGWNLRLAENFFLREKVKVTHDRNSVSERGSYPVIDQSEDGEIGFVDVLPEFDCSPQNPIVTFANHTCAVRKMTTPFGVIQNVFPLSSQVDSDVNFVYQALLSAIEPEGYKGHYPKLRETEFLTPPLPEQKKIASILTSVDEMIENTQKQIDKLQDLKKATMNELLTKGIGHTEFKDSELGRIPNSWEVRTVGSICKLSSGGTPDRSNQEYWGGEIPWIKTGEINYSRILDAEEKITTKGLTNSSAKIIPKGAVVMAMYGQGITRGRVAVLGIDATMNQACLAIIPNSDVTADFLYFSFYMQYESLRNLVQEGTQKNLSAGIIKEVLMSIPKVEEQEEISSILKSIEKSIFRFSTKLAQTQSLKKSLMQDLLTGKVRVMVN